MESKRFPPISKQSWTTTTAATVTTTSTTSTIPKRTPMRTRATLQNPVTGSSKKTAKIPIKAKPLLQERPLVEPDQVRVVGQVVGFPFRPQTRTSYTRTYQQPIQIPQILDDRVLRATRSLRSFPSAQRAKSSLRYFPSPAYARINYANKPKKE